MTPDEAMAVFQEFERADDYESLLWRVADGGIKLFATCSDFFHLATADAEEIMAEDIPLLQACLADLKDTDEEFYLAELFAARKRKMRPLSTKGMSTVTAALFDACSTAEERAEVDRRRTCEICHQPAVWRRKPECRPDGDPSLLCDDHAARIDLDELEELRASV